MKITSKNIKAFIQGNLRMLGDKFNALDEHLKEQVAYRASMCSKSCLEDNGGKCIKCGCSVPGKWYATASCNPEKFPDLMNQEEWSKYKEANNVG
jgi:hypothetical protein